MKKWYNYYGVIRKVSDNMSMTKRPKRQYSSEIINLEDMVPQDHFLRVIEEHFDWNFIYDEVESADGLSKPQGWGASKEQASDFKDFLAVWRSQNPHLRTQHDNKNG